MITDGEVAAFRRDGFVVCDGVLRADEAAAIGDRLDALARCGSDGLKVRRLEGATSGAPAGAVDVGQVAQLIGPAATDGVLSAHTADRRVLSIAGRLLGSDDLRVLGDQALMKPARHGGPVSWHQDAGYWADFVHDVDPPVAVTAWLAVDDVTEDNGCVRFVPGSHRAGALAHRFHECDAMRHVEGLDVDDARAAVMAAGGMSFHHSLAVHGSGPNLTDRRRRGYAVHYVRGDFGWRGAWPRPELPRVP